MLTIDPSKIKKCREHKGMSQEQLAERLNVSQSAYAKIEGGKRRIEAGLLFKIAEELDEKVEHFLDDSFTYIQNGNNEFKDNSALHQNNLNSTPKEIYEEHIKLLREEIAEMRKERKELIALLKAKM